MKIRITAAGIFGAKGPIKIGTEMTITGEPPAGWAGKYAVIEEPAAVGAKKVTNPAAADTAKSGAGAAEA